MSVLVLLVAEVVSLLHTLLFFNLVRMFEWVAAGPGARKAELVA